MTRDEAIKIAAQDRLFDNERFVDALVALGVLELDEPPKFSVDLIRAVKELRSCYDDTADFLDALAKRGLWIVEK